MATRWLPMTSSTQTLRNYRGHRWPSTSASFTSIASTATLWQPLSGHHHHTNLLKKRRYGPGRTPATPSTRAGLGQPQALGASGRRPGPNPRAGGFRTSLSWSRGHARQYLWPYIRLDVTQSGALTLLRRTEARSASAKSIRSVTGEHFLAVRILAPANGL